MPKERILDSSVMEFTICQSDLVIVIPNRNLKTISLGRKTRERSHSSNNLNKVRIHVEGYRSSHVAYLLAKCSVDELFPKDVFFILHNLKHELIHSWLEISRIFKATNSAKKDDEILIFLFEVRPMNGLWPSGKVVSFIV